MREELRLKFECLKRNFGYRDDFPKLKKFMDLPVGGYGVFEDGEILTPHDFALLYGFNDPPFSQNIEHIFPFLDPVSETPDIDLLADILRPEPVLPWTNKVNHPKRYGWRKDLEPYERLFMVDLRAKKKDILADFEKRLSEIYEADQWQEDSSRYRKEAWTALKVWDMRREKISFPKISLKLKISADTAKHSFYRAFELTQNKQYDVEALRRDLWLIKKEELKKTCDTCDLRDTCDTLCPDVLAHTNQDKVSRKEKLFDDPDYIESLSFDDTF